MQATYNFATHPIFEGITQIYNRAAGELTASEPSALAAWVPGGQGVVGVAEVGAALPGGVVAALRAPRPGRARGCRGGRRRGRRDAHPGAIRFERGGHARPGNGVGDFNGPTGIAVWNGISVFVNPSGI